MPQGIAVFLLISVIGKIHNYHEPEPLVKWGEATALIVSPTPKSPPL